MGSSHLRIYGAAEHNLQNIDVEIPRNSLTVVTGLSGSGKSSLAFDTIYAEGQRRYIESLSAYARQFLDQLPKPEVEYIEGLSPAVSIEQKTVSRNPRSTVGTVTEIYDYLRLLYATIGRPHCPKCDRPLEQQTPETIARQAMKLPARTRLVVMAPVVRGRKGEYQALFQKALKDGFTAAKIDGEVMELDPKMRLKRMYKHDISLVLDKVIIKKGAEDRLASAVSRALDLAEGFAILEVIPDRDGHFPEKADWTGERMFSAALGCPEHGPQVVEIAPRVFSFNSRYGQCEHCEGIGTVPEVDEDRLIANPTLSIREGAVQPWSIYFDRRGNPKKKLVEMSTHAQQLFQVMERYDVELDTPWNDLTKLQRDVLLLGFRGERKPKPQKGKPRKGAPPIGSWRGVIGRLERKLELAEDSDEIEEIEAYLAKAPCPSCNGTRLKKESLAVTVGGKNIAEIAQMDLRQSAEFFEKLEVTDREQLIGGQPLREITDRLGFLLNVGLHYLTLDRPAGSLSGGEAQRIRLATQIGASLTGVLYVLDEPSIGLHQRDNEKLINTLESIRDQGNTVIVVEHDEQTIRTADWVVDLGPGAGRQGGHVVAQGTPKTITSNKKSITGQYLRGDHAIATPKNRRKPGKNFLELFGCSLHNLKETELKLPVGLLVGITGVSGSGKSSLIMETMLPLLMNHCYKASHKAVGPHKKAKGIEHYDRCIHVDQSPIGRTPRSNPVTYTKVFDEIRKLFSMTPDAKMRGYGPGRFSFNVKGGRCEECKGQGHQKIEMDFLPNVYVACETCKTRRYNDETLEVKYKGRSIADVLEMTVSEAVEFFSAVATTRATMKLLDDVGLGYLHLGQAATTLSGGEAQRIKLARELSKKNTGRTMYILDEPTTGLHFADVQKLLDVVNKLVDTGSTVIIIEHNLDIIKSCDWLIDLGPEGGEEGGRIIAQGPPEVVAASKTSETARFLRDVVKAKRNRQSRKKG